MKKSITWYLMNVFLFLSTTLASAQNFVTGSIITNSKDTISCTILNLKNKKEDERSSYNELEIVDSLGLKKKLYPKDISAYIKEGVTYKSFYLEGGEIFMKLMVDGKILLYYHPGNKADEEKYIFKRKTENTYNLFDYAAGFKKIDGYISGTSSKSSSGGNIVVTIDRSKVFISYFTEYLKDCSAVSRKIKTEFYKITDMVEIFKEYNMTCAKTGSNSR